MKKIMAIYLVLASILLIGCSDNGVEINGDGSFVINPNNPGDGSLPQIIVQSVLVGDRSARIDWRTANGQPLPIGTVIVASLNGVEYFDNGGNEDDGFITPGATAPFLVNNTTYSGTISARLGGKSGATSAVSFTTRNLAIATGQIVVSVGSDSKLTWVTEPGITLEPGEGFVMELYNELEYDTSFSSTSIIRPQNNGNYFVRLGPGQTAGAIYNCFSLAIRKADGNYRGVDITGGVTLRVNLPGGRVVYFTSPLTKVIRGKTTTTFPIPSP